MSHEADCKYSTDPVGELAPDMDFSYMGRRVKTVLCVKRSGLVNAVHHGWIVSSLSRWLVKTEGSTMTVTAAIVPTCTGSVRLVKQRVSGAYKLSRRPISPTWQSSGIREAPGSQLSSETETVSISGDCRKVDLEVQLTNHQ
jgi:hypothetical protein